MLVLIGLLFALITVILGMVLSVMIVVAIIKKNPFPKKMLLITVSGVLIVTAIYVYEWYFFTFEEIDSTHRQEGPGPIQSPEQTYTADAHYEPYGGAAGGVNVWVEIVDHKADDQTNVIYYSDAKRDVAINWVDNETLAIENEDPSYPNQDRSVTLNVDTEIYHDRGDACRSWVLEQDYDDCYEADL